MKYSSSILFAAGLAAAQSTVVKILFPFADDQDNGASVISAGPTATKYFVTCPPGTSEEDCGLADGVEIIYGPSTMSYAMSYSEIYTVSADCKLNPSKDEASCSGAVISDRGTSIVVEVMTGYSSYIMPVTVTAGLEKLSAGAGASNIAAPGSSATDAPSVSTPTTMATSAAPTNSEGSGDDDAADPTSSSSTGGLPRVTQNAVIMGAAALVGGAILL